MQRHTQRRKFFCGMLVFVLLAGLVPQYFSEAEAHSVVKPKIVQKATIKPRIVMAQWKIAKTLVTNTLDVTLDPQIKSSTTPQGANDHPSLSFNLRAGRKNLRVDQITLSGFYDANGDSVFGSTPGSETLSGQTKYLNSIISAVKLYDQFGQFVGSPDVLSADGRVIFENLNFYIPAYGSKALYAKVDITPDANADGVTKKFALDIVNEKDVLAVNTYGPGSVKVNDGDGVYTDLYLGPNYKKTVMVTVSTLIIADNTINVMSSNEVGPKTVVPGTNSILNDTFMFQSTVEAIRIERLTLKPIYQPTGSGAQTIPNPIAKITIQYPSDLNNQNIVETKVLNGNAEYYYFDNMNFMIPASKDYYAKLNVSIDLLPDAKNSNIRLDFVAGLPSNFRAVGVASAAVYDENDVQNVQGLGKTIVYQSKPYFATVSGISNCPNQIQYGDQAAIYCFSLRADQRGDIDLSQISVGYNTQNLMASSGSGSNSAYRLYDLNSGQQLAAIPVPVSGSGSGTLSTLTFHLNYPLAILAGQTKYFIVKGPQFKKNLSSPSSYSARLLGDGVNISQGVTEYAARIYATVWSDLRIDSHSVYTSDWYNGFTIETLPTVALALAD